MSQIQNIPMGARLNSGHPLCRGLIGCWFLNEINGTSRKLSNQGGRAFDSSVYGNHGTLFCNDGGNRRTTQGTYFDGVDDRYSIPHKNILNITKSLSIYAWVMHDLTDTNLRVIMSKEGGAGTQDANFRLRINNDGGKLRFSWTNPVASFQTFPGNTILPLNVWSCVGLTAYTDDTNTVRGTFYLNGKPDGTFTGANNTPFMINNTNSTLNIGCTNLNGTTPSHFFHGWIRQAMVWNRVLTGIEMKQLYQDPLQIIITRGVR